MTAPAPAPQQDNGGVFLVGYGATFLTVELKTSKALPPSAWQDCVVAAQGQDGAGNNNNKATVAKCAAQLDRLRNSALKPERSEAGLFALLLYTWQLDHLDAMRQESAAAVVPQPQFVWGECFINKKEAVYKTLLEEKACALFNVGARCSQLGAMQDVWSKESLKAAAVYFQRAAGVFLHIRDRLVVRFEHKPAKNSDLNEASLTALYNVMLAQAHECYFEFTNIESPHSLVAAQVAMQTAEYYDVAQRNSNEKVGFMDHPRFPKAWVEHMHAKCLLFSALAHVHVPPTIEGKELGERIYHLRTANDLLTKATASVNATKGIQTNLCHQIKKYHETVHGQLTFSSKLNSDVNRELIPKDVEVTPIKRSSTPLVHAMDIGTPKDWLNKGFASAHENIFDILLTTVESERWTKHAESLAASLALISTQIATLQERLSSAYNWLSATSLLPTDDATTARHAMLESLLASQQQVVTISADRAALEGTLVSTVPRSSTLVADVAAQMESVRSLQQSISTLQQMAQPALDWCQQFQKPLLQVEAALAADPQAQVYSVTPDQPRKAAAVKPSKENLTPTASVASPSHAAAKVASPTVKSPAPAASPAKSTASPQVKSPAQPLPKVTRAVSSSTTVEPLCTYSADVRAQLSFENDLLMKKFIKK